MLLRDSRLDDRTTANVTFPVDVCLSGARTFSARIDPGCELERITLDPYRRFPDRDASDNVWPREATPYARSRTTQPGNAATDPPATGCA